MRLSIVSDVLSQDLNTAWELLQEFSGEATDYFESVRGSLRRVMGEAELEELAGFVRGYAYEEALGVLERWGKVQL